MSSLSRKVTRTFGGPGWLGFWFIRVAVKSSSVRSMSFKTRSLIMVARFSSRRCVMLAKSSVCGLGARIGGLLGTCWFFRSVFRFVRRLGGMRSQFEGWVKVCCCSG